MSGVVYAFIYLLIIFMTDIHCFVPYLQVVPDLAAEEIVTIDSDNDHDIEELFVQGVPSVEYLSDDLFNGHQHNDSDSNDDAASIEFGDVLGGSDSTPEIQLENVDSSDGHSVIITEDENSNQIVRSSSSNSIESMGSRSNERPDEAALLVGHQDLESQNPDIGLSYAAAGIVSSETSVPTTMTSVTDNSADLLNQPESSSIILPTNLDCSMECFKMDKPKQALKAPTESPTKCEGEDGEVMFIHCSIIQETLSRLFLL